MGLLKKIFEHVHDYLSYAPTDRLSIYTPEQAVSHAATIEYRIRNILARGNRYKASHPEEMVVDLRAEQAVIAERFGLDLRPLSIDDVRAPKA